MVLAAGMGSRYGGLKQMDAFGPNGETIIDYSIYDAIEAGFSSIVFVIRDSFQDDFKAFFKGKFEDKIEIHYALQQLDNVPSGYDIHPEREKPWGTAHAVQMAKPYVDGPFAVINADDYYGKEAYSTLMSFFKKHTDAEGQYGIVGYYLDNTLSEYGTVNRGVCTIDEQGHLKGIKECTKIKKDADGIIRYPQDAEEKHELAPRSIVSMNMFGFFPSYFDHFDKHFSAFLKEGGMELKSEFYIPTLLDILIGSGELTLQVLESDSEWFGVTYQDDKPFVVARIEKLIESGAYPSKLWS